MTRIVGIALVALVFSACNCGGTVDLTCQSDAQCAVGSACVNGTCVAGPGGNGGDGGDGGPGGVFTGCDPNHTENATRDTDCDGLSDAEEYSASYGGGQKTDPCKTDSDGDGVADGVEVGKTSSVSAACTAFTPDAEPNSKTDPTNADTDGDSLPDGTEDKNANGKVDPGEADPSKKDSDCDGLNDAFELGGSAGCALDPLSRDTDQDGLPDGVETGNTQGADPMGCTYGADVFDQDPASTTNACTADTDGDGVMDGAEDLDKNGKVDSGELNPNDAADGQGPAQQACSTQNLKPISFHLAAAPDVQVALIPGFTEITKFTDGATEKGVMFYDPAAQIAGFAFTRAPVGSNPTAEENDGRQKLGSQGSVSAPITQTFTTWDGFAAVRATYDVASSADLKTFTNALVQAFVPNAASLLANTAGATGPFKVQAEYVIRSQNRAVVAVAVIPQAAYTGQRVFAVDDVAGGSALAQYKDYAATQCEVFTTAGNATVDFLWVVDDSCSMGGYQTAVGNAGSVFSQKLGSAGLDWRVGAVTTGYYPTTFDGSIRPFTSNITTMQSWFGGSNTFGTSGATSERALQASRYYIQTSLLPKTTDATQNKIRTGADLHVIILADADDQDSEAITNYVNFFNNYDAAGSKAVVHGIVCPQGQTCGETQRNPRRNLEVIQATGGVAGDINVAQSGSPQLANTLDAILSSAIAGTGKQLQKPPISATIKVAIETGGTVGTCNVADVPRDRTSGFDFDSASRRVVFYGACRPNGAGKKVAVSYRHWIDGSPDPDGDTCNNMCTPPLVCMNGQCVCPTDCGGCSTGLTCNPNTCTCDPPIN